MSYSTSSSLHPAPIDSAFYINHAILPLYFSPRRESRRTEMTSLTQSACSLAVCAATLEVSAAYLPKIVIMIWHNCQFAWHETLHVIQFSKKDSNNNYAHYLQVHPGFFFFYNFFFCLFFPFLIYVSGQGPTCTIIQYNLKYAIQTKTWDFCFQTVVCKVALCGGN